jgi:hypothetical protein
VTRRLFTILSALSLLLSVAVVVLWVRSYWTRDQYTQSDGTSFRGYLSQRGGFGYNKVTTGTQGPEWEWSYDSMSVAAEAEAPSQHETPLWQRWLGVEWRDNSGTLMGVTYRDKGWWVKYRMFAIPLAVLPTIWLVRLSRQHVRRRRLRCTQCGYDLRATPERCPECGNVASA